MDIEGCGMLATIDFYGGNNMIIGGEDLKNMIDNVLENEISSLDQGAIKPICTGSFEYKDVGENVCKVIDDIYDISV